MEALLSGRLLHRMFPPKANVLNQQVQLKIREAEAETENEDFHFLNLKKGITPI